MLSDGESALEDKETMKSLLNEADWVGIGSRKHGEKDVVELEFWFELAEKLKKVNGYEMTIPHISLL